MHVSFTFVIMHNIASKLDYHLMPNSELFLITATFIFTLVGSIVAIVLFIRQYNREKRDKEAAAQKKQAQSAKVTKE